MNENGVELTYGLILANYRFRQMAQDLGSTKYSISVDLLKYLDVHQPCILPQNKKSNRRYSYSRAVVLPLYSKRVGT